MARRLELAATAMIHRGPDASGFARPCGAMLAFQRLAILDLSADGNQPMTNETGDVWLVFNGEIYDHRQLRAQLEESHRFRSKTDTEVLIHGYEEWGMDGLLKRISGMFAFALWDSRAQELFLARDRMGKKPLYYAETREGIVFASTLNAICELLPSQPDIDWNALDDYLVYQAVPAPRTIYSGVSALPPAHVARCAVGKPPRIEPYWQPTYARKQRRSESDLLAELDHLVREAVRKRLESDVPLGAFLSGGVDSSLVVAVMSDLGAGPVEAINVGFENPQFDERGYARLVANKWEAHLHEHVMRSDEVLSLPEIVWHYGQPMADVSIVPTYAVARAAREHVTVVLNGDGGDELFAGYARPIVARAAQAVRSAVPGSARPPAASLLRLAGRPGHLLAQAMVQESRQAFAYDRGLRAVRSALYTRDFACRLGESDPDALYNRVWDAADGPTDADRALYGDLVTYLPDQLLVKMDVSTMAHSVEARSPLLDQDLIEFAATIPVAQLTRGFQTKYLLKRLAERYVPKQVLYRRKRGFVMPASQWLRGELACYARILLSPDSVASRGIVRPDAVGRMLDEHLSGDRDWGHVLWTLMVMELWFRLAVDRTLTRADRLDAMR